MEGKKKRTRRTRAEIDAGITLYDKRNNKKNPETTLIERKSNKKTEIEEVTKSEIETAVPVKEPTNNKLVGDNITRVILDILKNTSYETKRVNSNDLTLALMNEIGARGYKYCFELFNKFYFQRPYNIDKRKRLGKK